VYGESFHRIRKLAERLASRLKIGRVEPDTPENDFKIFFNKNSIVTICASLHL